MRLRVPPPARLRELWRYGQAGLANSAFGYTAYAVLVRAGLLPLWAQLIAHLMGMAFNYWSYTRHVFRDAAANRLRFVLAYAVNYLVSLAVLWLMLHVIHSPYVAGLVSLVLVSVFNYFVLRKLVFVRPTETRPHP